MRRPAAAGVVGIDGIDGSGKSRFAAALAAACAAEGCPAVVVHVDDFRRPVDWAAAGADETQGPAEANVYYDGYYDLSLLDRCVRAFLDGAGAVTVPRFDPGRERLDGHLELSFAGASLLLVEGIFLRRVPALAAAPLVWLEVPDGEARRRLLERDLGRGRPREVIEHRLARRYLPAQARYREAHDPAAGADVVIDNQDWSAPRMLRCESQRLPDAVERALRRVVLP